jgi:CheY-like chemotaxis protein/HPt (histidine-containing phosphotransfer) domain-containing protein
MDINEIPGMFKPFSRMQNPLKAEGSGFGMYVTKGLIDLLKGTIEVTSEKGKGTSVTIALPVRQISDRVPNGDANSDLSGSDNTMQQDIPFGKILLFEDDLSLGGMIREYLVRNGYKVKLCSNPQDVHGFLRVISQFDIVFTDMQMTGITGTDILSKIREKDTRIPIWLMTAHDDYTTERALSEGFSGLVRKPIRMSKLLEIVAGRQYPENKEQAPTEDSLKDKFPQLVSLFGDDTQIIQDILAGFVESANKDMDTLATYIEEEEFEKAQQLSHRIHPFFSQLDADHLCAVLRKMDMLRGEDESTYPNWKEELLKTIEEIRQFTVDLRENYLS